MPDMEITITCPVCEEQFARKASEMPDGTVIKCPKCGEQTTIQGDMFTKMAESLDSGTC